MRSARDGIVTTSLMQQGMGLMIQEFNDALMMLPMSQRPTDRRVASKEASLAMYAARFHTMGRSTVEMSSELAQALDHTRLGDVRVGDIRFPHRYFWMSLNNVDCGGLPGSENRIDGAYVDSTMVGMNGPLQIVLTTRLEESDPFFDSEWPRRTEPYFYVPCQFQKDDTRTFQEVLDKAISEGEIKMSEEFAKDLSLPKSAEIERDDDFDLVEVDGREIKLRWKDTPRLTTLVDTTRQNDLIEIERNRLAMPNVRRALSLVVNLLAYMSLSPDEIETASEWTGDAPVELIDQAKNGRSSGKRQWAEQQLANRYTRIKVVGLKHKPKPQSASSEDGGELQFSHMRIGHFRTQTYGPKNSLRKLIWVRPTRVRPDLELKDVADGTQYVVEERVDLQPGSRPRV
jgi:hypothetical protein